MGMMMLVPILMIIMKRKIRAHNSIQAIKIRTHHNNNKHNDDSSNCKTENNHSDLQ